MPDPKPFVILTTVRTGSYHLVGRLDAAPDLTCYGEVFKENFVELPARARHALSLEPDDAPARDAMGLDFVRRLLALTPGTPTGFKLFPPHLRQRPDLLAWLESGAFRIVILSRPLLEVAVSFGIALETGVYVRTGDRTQTREHDIEITDEWLGKMERMMTVFRKPAQRLRGSAGVEHFDITYAETLGGPRLAKLLAFLGSAADPDTLESTYQQQSHRPLHQRVRNWPWLVDHLRATDRLALLGEAGYRPDGTPWDPALNAS